MAQRVFRGTLADGNLATDVVLSGCAVEQPDTDGGWTAPIGSRTGSGPVPSPGDIATWRLAPDKPLDPRTTFLVVEVTRLGCASGVTGTVLDPQIHYGDARVLLQN